MDDRDDRALQADVLTTEPGSEIESGLEQALAFSADDESQMQSQSSPSDQHEPALVGKIFSDKYRITSVLGRGGMSVVYQAKDLALQRDVALKVLHLEGGSNQTNYGHRLQQEARACAQLDHPNVVKVHDLIVPADGTAPYLVMDFVAGRSLAEILEQEHALPAHEAISTFIKIADGLAHAHQHQIVHRDLKPGNVMLARSSDGHCDVKIVDFGIAKLSAESGQCMKLTQTGQPFGSPQYMSPEQCLARQLDQRSDLYSLGCLMYEVLSGSPPFVADSVLEVMHGHLTEDPASLHDRAKYPMPPGLCEVVARLLLKNPEDRYQNAQELKQDLEQIVKGKKPKLRLPWTRRERKFFMMFNAVIAISMVVSALLFWIHVNDERLVQVRSKELEARNLEEHEQFARAEQLLLSAKANAPDINERIEILRRLAGLAQKQEDPKKEFAYWKDCIGLVEQLKNTYNYFSDYRSAANCAIKINDFRSADKYGRTGLIGCYKNGQTRSQEGAEFYSLIAIADAGLFDFSEAERLADMALKIRLELLAHATEPSEKAS